MKKLAVLLIFSFVAYAGKAQKKDTLRNLPEDAALTISKYSGGADWGYWTGHNHLGRQQFAEKYHISGKARVTGVVSNLTGKVSRTSPDSSAFNIWSVGANRFPAQLLSSKVVRNADLNVSGEACYVSFNTPVAVSDSFFVAFDLFDYSHGSVTDTIGLMHGPQGSRTNKDLFGRNVIQVHSHGAPVWRDFATQNFTPIRTHLAIYPLVEFDVTAGTQDYAGNLDLKIYAPYPNPAAENINLSFSVTEAAEVSVEITDMSGKEVYRKDRVKAHGDVVENVNLDGLIPGVYIYIIRTEKASLAGRFTVM